MLGNAKVHDLELDSPVVKDLLSDGPYHVEWLGRTDPDPAEIDHVSSNRGLQSGFLCHVHCILLGQRCQRSRGHSPDFQP